MSAGQVTDDLVYHGLVTLHVAGLYPLAEEMWAARDAGVITPRESLGGFAALLRQAQDSLDEDGWERVAAMIEREP